MNTHDHHSASTTELSPRLGLNVHRQHWPTTTMLKGVEAAGYGWVQIHTPPRGMLCDRERLRRHARGVRAALEPTGLRLLLHGPDDLSLGALDHDRAFDGLLDYAVEARAEIVAYHALNHLDADGPAGERSRLRAEGEERALARLGRRAHALGITVAVENLAPVHPGPAYLSHDPLRVHDLVRRLRNPSVGMLLDIGHAHITSGIAGTDLGDVVARVAPEVALFHVHDNLGARRHDLGFPGVDPLRLDLHLPPGAGTLPWDRVRDVLLGHRAPLMLEVEPSHRPSSLSLMAVQTTAVLHGARPMVAAAA
ncbi:sugar phosphate isomerase/epimerase family protein [Paraconexibacter sp.]|uniref:sugar phosphate isomerase/epimerase family protein n=1 Tax=Paraconexibacter sp. TaxID=2949640 RepID=UPI0035639C1C